MDESDVVCQVAATVIAELILTGQLPTNVWAFIRPVYIYGTDEVVAWTILTSPN